VRLASLLGPELRALIRESPEELKELIVMAGVIAAHVHP
jgi:hypothetical protein